MIIEIAAEICRRSGLVLQPEKTDIRLATTIDERRKRRDEFVEERFTKRPQDDSTWEWLFSNSYEDAEPTDGEKDDSDEMSPEEIDAAYMALLIEWKEADATADGDSVAFGLVGRALAALREANARVPDEVLKQIVFKDATKLEQVLRYVSVRSEIDANWKTIRALVEMHRQSPWAKIWLLNTIDKFDGSDGNLDVEAVLTWARAQLADTHEHVRAEAAWTMSGKDDVKPDLMDLFGRASRMTRSGIAAACGRVGTLTKEETSAVRGEGPLAAAAFDWASRL
jgi:RNA-directed DNA polymerase